MTFIDSGHCRPPEARLLDVAPVDSRIVIVFEVGKHIYRKQPNGLWRGVAWVPGRPPAPMGGELSSLTFSVFDRETWRLHHPGLIRVTGRYAVAAGTGRFVPGRPRPREFQWRWACGICDDRSFGAFLVDGDAHDDAKAHIANHVEVAREARR